LRLQPVADKGNKELISEISRTRDIQEQILIQLKLANKYNQEITSEEFAEDEV